MVQQYPMLNLIQNAHALHSQMLFYARLCMCMHMATLSECALCAPYTRMLHLLHAHTGLRVLRQMLRCKQTTYHGESIYTHRWL